MQEGAFVFELCEKEFDHDELANIGHIQEARNPARTVGDIAQIAKNEIDGNAAAETAGNGRLFGCHFTFAGVQEIGSREWPVQVCGIVIVEIARCIIVN